MVLTLIGSPCLAAIPRPPFQRGPSPPLSHQSGVLRGRRPAGRLLRFTERHALPGQLTDPWRTIIGVSPPLRQGAPKVPMGAPFSILALASPVLLARELLARHLSGRSTDRRSEIHSRGTVVNDTAHAPFDNPVLASEWGTWVSDGCRRCSRPVGYTHPNPQACRT